MDLYQFYDHSCVEISRVMSVYSKVCTGYIEGEFSVFAGLDTVRVEKSE